MHWDDFVWYPATSEGKTSCFFIDDIILERFKETGKVIHCGDLKTDAATILHNQ